MTTETPRLLIVDDDLSTTQTFAQILTMEGYEVHTAATAESGALTLPARLAADPCRQAEGNQ